MLNLNIRLYTFQELEENAKRKAIIEGIEINEYYFFFDGTPCDVLHCTSGPLSGKTVVRIHGENYFL